MKNAYLQRVYDQVLQRDPDMPEFHQCIREFLESLEEIVDDHPEWEKNGILEMVRTGVIALERGAFTLNEDTKVRGEFNYGKNVR